MFKPHIQAMSAYTPPLEGRSTSGCLLLDFNESTQPPPAFVIDALSHFLASGRLQVYPEYADLAEKIGHYVQLSAKHCLFTNGSDQAIDVLMRLLVNPGDQVVLLSPSFAMFEQAAGLEHADIVEISYCQDFSFPYQEVEAAIATGLPKVVVLVNPNNPTGTPIERKFLERLIQSWPQTFFIVDEAYYEFHGETVKDMVPAHRNMAVLRTFSKAFALAALRMGYLLAHEDVVEQLLKVRGPYDVNMLGAVAAAAALDSPGYMHDYVAEVMNHAKPMLTEYLRQHSIDVYEGRANFLLLRPDDPDALMAFLKTRGILVRRGRRVASSMVRMSIGTRQDVQRCIAALDEYLSHHATQEE